jgi:hypothetical protein
VTNIFDEYLDYINKIPSEQLISELLESGLENYTEKAENPPNP